MNTTSESGRSPIVSIEHGYVKFYPILLRWAGKILGTNVYVHDAVQDVFVAICQQNSCFVSEAAMLNYLYSSVYNKCIDLLRHKQLEYRHEAVYAERLKNETPAAPTELLDQELSVLVDNRIANLPPKCRQIFVMKYRDEQSNQEISESLNLSARTIENQVFIARNTLRKYIKSYLCS